MAENNDSDEPVQKAPRRRKCKNHLVQLAEMYPDVMYTVAADYGSSDQQIYVMEVMVGGKVIHISNDLLNPLQRCPCCDSGVSKLLITTILFTKESFSVSSTALKG